MSVTDTFEAMLDKGQDSALLRFSLGNAYVGEGKPKQAVAHLREARRVKRYILTAQLV